MTSFSKYQQQLLDFIIKNNNAVNKPIISHESSFDPAIILIKPPSQVINGYENFLAGLDYGLLSVQEILRLNSFLPTPYYNSSNAWHIGKGAFRTKKGYIEHVKELEIDQQHLSEYINKLKAKLDNDNT